MGRQEEENVNIINWFWRRSKGCVYWCRTDKFAKLKNAVNVLQIGEAAGLDEITRKLIKNVDHCV